MRLVREIKGVLGFKPYGRGRASEYWCPSPQALFFPTRVTSWADVDADDYALPLGSAPDFSGGLASIIEHVRCGLAAAVWQAWSSAEDDASREALRTHIAAMSLEDALALGRRVYGDWYACAHRPFRDETSRTADPQASALEAVEVLNRFLQLLATGTPIEADPLELTRLAFHSAVNAVAVCPAAFAFSEMLSVAVWLGYLHRGRQASMPGFIAAFWTAMVDGSDNWPQPAWAPDAFLVAKAASIFQRADLDRSIELASRSRHSVFRR